MTSGTNSSTGKYECSGICSFNANPVSLGIGEKVQFLFDVKFTVNFPIYRSEIYIDGYYLEPIDENTPIFEAFAMPSQTLICSNGILVSDLNGGTFSISNANGKISVKGLFPTYSQAASGEICIVNSGGYKNLVLK
jgi:hypothetical protein